MQRGTIWSIAAACGLAAFALTLARPPAPDPAPLRQPARHDIPSLARFLSENPEDLRSWFELATLREEAGDEAGARAAWEAILHDGPSQAASNDRLWFMIAWASDRLGDPAAITAWTHASKDYESRVDAGHFNWMFFDRLAWTRKRTGNDAGAVEAWNQAIEMLARDPHTSVDPRAGLDLARELAMAGKTGEALDALERIDATLEAGPLLRDIRLEPLRQTERFKELVGRAVLRKRNGPNV